MSPLLHIIRDPSGVQAFSMDAWNRLLRESRAHYLCARLSCLIEDRGLAPTCPPEVWSDLTAQRFFAEHKQAQVRLELRKLHKALAPRGIPMLLLKGAAYAHAGLRVACGRDFADLDIMVPRAQLEAAETALEAGGWLTETKHRYDQRYYRRWMHELPPLHHRTRSFEVDVHHALLPLTGRLRPDPTLLWAASRRLPDSPYRVLCDEDMLLHSAAQVFQDSEIAGELRALLDLHQLMAELGQREGFWQRLLARAQVLELGRPLHYALRYCHRMLGTPVPAGVLDAAAAHAPGAPVQRLMDLLVPRVLEPRSPGRPPARMAVWLLFVRSHWLRMPPGLLAAHLLRKAFRTGKG
ncbi:nucleotidyltransferase family protein [uncultured Thiohalocapsa sp.]|uniref:nucleotidyltransferase domain-containing protein n=1 Tax=uncultured Thiohalocapsa sp. TaxID=768990 RepID=UPI0025EE9A28|nr:nucleotidyltransferase family protein [uncultured Thiohalocapsa sp.]